MEKKRHPLCDLRESIQMNIHLLIKTHYGDYRFNKDYGCYIWNKDYSVVTNVSKWKDELCSLIKDTIEKYEVRLEKIKVNLVLEDAEFSEKFKDQPLRLKKKITIKIEGMIGYLNESFEHYEYLFFSPLSIG